MKEEIVENNKLIAEFMGSELETTCKYNDHEDDVPKPHYRYDNFTKKMMQHYCVRMGNIGHFVTPEGMKFNKSWDWLIPVVEKIGNLDFHAQVIISNNCCKISTNRNTTNDPLYFELLKTNENKIEAVYEAVIEFIKWYNERKQDGEL